MVKVKFISYTEIAKLDLPKIRGQLNILAGQLSQAASLDDVHILRSQILRKMRLLRLCERNIRRLTKSRY